MSCLTTKRVLLSSVSIGSLLLHSCLINQQESFKQTVLHRIQTNAVHPSLKQEAISTINNLNVESLYATGESLCPSIQITGISHTKQTVMNFVIPGIQSLSAELRETMMAQHKAELLSYNAVVDAAAQQICPHQSYHQ